MKIIHCADVHLDSKMTAHLSPEQARQRRRELLHTFQKMVEYAAQEEVKAILIAGDLFDSSVASALTKNAVYEAIAGNPAIDFYYLRGNHDADSFIKELTDIPPNLKLFGEAWTYYIANAEGAENIVISGIEAKDGVSQAICEELALDRRSFNIVILHGQEVQSAADGREDLIDIRALQNKGIDYLALGHIHTYKLAKLDARASYCYSGCLEARGFDECGEHGFALLEIDEEARSCRHCFIPFADRRFHEILLDISECRTNGEIAAKFHQNLRQRGCSAKDMVKLVLTGRQALGTEKDVEMLTRQLRRDFYFFRIYDKAGWQADYQQYENDCSLRGELVRTVRRQEELTEDERAEILQYGFMALSGEVIE